MSHFAVYGTFAIPRDDKGMILRDLSGFWQPIESEFPGLSTAIGIYVFGLRPSGAPTVTPWYVGKCVNVNGFKAECFTPHKRDCYADAMAGYERAVPGLFLVARMTEGGRFSQDRSLDEIGFLEKYFIGLTIHINPEIVNRRNTVSHTGVIVPGILNTPPGNPGTAAVNLRAAFGLGN